ncbi:hypothetical protein GW765_03750 [Candidatus Parcubacteria bacterium]|nr:hypothetical protein [Candidatus Parcubacteria bacterium]
MNFLYLLLTISGYVIGLGAVTVIDIHGLLGRKSAYWTEATTRTHKVTKPLIWIGTFMALSGGILFYNSIDLVGLLLGHVVIFAFLMANGIFLSFWVSPFLLKREKEGHQAELLPKNWQRRITVSFLVSFTGWWGSLSLLLYAISEIAYVY